MLKVILQAPRPIPPFNESARDLRIQNVPLWLWQRNLLAPFVTKEMEIPSNARLPLSREPMLVYRDNLFFDEFYINEFIKQAKKRGRPARAAFSISRIKRFQGFQIFLDKFILSFAGQFNARFDFWRVVDHLQQRAQCFLSTLGFGKKPCAMLGKTFLVVAA